MIVSFLLSMILGASPCFAADTPAVPSVQQESATDQEAVTLDAAKSFAAWNIKYGSKYDGFDAAWQGWLDDPQVPERFKMVGLAAKDKIKSRVEDLQNKTMELKGNAEGLGEKIERKIESTKESLEKAWEDFLNRTIKGEKKE